MVNSYLNMELSTQHSGLPNSTLAQASHQLEGYLQACAQASQDTDYSTPESFLALPSDTKLRARVLNLAQQKKTADLKEIFVLGLGGSYLGAKAVIDALYGLNREKLPPSSPHITFIDTIHGSTLIAAQNRLNTIFVQGGEALIIAISKSGATTETIANLMALLPTLKHSATDWQKYVVVITEPGSKFEHWANSQHIEVLPNPQQVGGRFSVMSPVGIFPLALAGVDVTALHAGASAMLKFCLKPDATLNPALQSATVVYHQIQQKKYIYDHFYFQPDYETIGKWARQLLAESLGKEKDNEGHTINAGITPTVSIGSTDLHAVAQLYLAGPKDKLFSFVCVEEPSSLTLRPDQDLEAMVPHLGGKTLKQIMQAIYQSTITAFTSREIPLMEITLTDSTAFEIGEYLQYKMLETILLAKLLNIDAFGQANVEEYKQITRELLAKS